MTFVARRDALSGLGPGEARPHYLVAASGTAPAHADPWSLAAIPTSGLRSVRSLLTSQNARTLAVVCLPWLVLRRVLERWLETPVLPVGPGSCLTLSREVPVPQAFFLSSFLPDKVQVDLSNILPRAVFQDAEWEVLAKNGTATISSEDGRQQGTLALAQYMMLQALSAGNPLHDQDDSTLFHKCVLGACRSHQPRLPSLRLTGPG